MPITPKACEGEERIHEEVHHLVETDDGLYMGQIRTRKSSQNQDDDSAQDSRVTISGQSFQGLTDLCFVGSSVHETVEVGDVVHLDLDDPGFAVRIAVDELGVLFVSEGFVDFDDFASSWAYSVAPFAMFLRRFMLA